ncbi:hypothetical protein C8R41DRAFT_982751 [Lentinula lateritia]|uniref:Uncharacterized protein n=1 Tax=Lentinula lateritia TaxID=40482 RepID=A0ABQ8V955_9AGAR|nr:hypothetical protein C8R41DRAFT_982751 [Lentinula lateritia]
MTMTGSFSLLFLLFFKYGQGDPSCPILLLLVLIYTSTVAVSFYIQVPQTSATIIGATTGSVVAVHAGSLTFVKAGSASDLSRIASSSDLTTLPFLPTSSVDTCTDTLSLTSTMISSSSPSAKSSSGNSIHGLSHKAKAITLAVIGIVFVLGAFLVIYLRKKGFITQHRQIAVFCERLAQTPGLSKLGVQSTWSSQSGSTEATSQRSSNMGLREDSIIEEGLEFDNSVRTTISERERGSGWSYRFTIASGSSSQVIF